jgi:2-polyprenyl-3-methyl-5-hydroxy-6-metoxy-1,4-benzoquinol methylase
LSFDLDVAKAFALKVWEYAQGEMIAAMVHLGDRLDLYQAIYTQGPATSELLADATGLDERWLREWLFSQAAAGLVERSDDGFYSLTDEQAAVLVDEDSLLFATATFGGGFSREDYDRMEHSMQTGIGFTYGEMGIDQARQINRMNAPWLRDFLPEVVVPMLPGVVDKLTAGGRVLDIGCGGGVALEGLADRYPESTFVGMDSSGPAIEVARERFDGRANVEFHLEGGETLNDERGFDLVMTLDCLHDMARPDQTAEAIRGALAPGGTWLIKEMRCGPTYESNLGNPLQALMYGYSVSSCLASATVTEDGLGLGALGLDPDTLAKLVEDAGFGSCHQLETPDPTHYYYRVAR